MKNKYFPFIATAWIVAFSIFACTDPKVKPPTNPPIVVVADTAQSWYCTPIAPMVSDRAVGGKGKFWQPGQTIKIGFMSGGDEPKKMLVRNAFASIAQSANLKFTFPETGPYDIRVAFAAGSAWSYVGVDAKSVSSQYPTLNFGFGYGAAEIAAGRSIVIEHEALHSVGCLHEMQLKNGVCWNEANVIADLSNPPNSWSLAQIRFNVLDYHNPANIITTGYDKESAMHYAVPARWTCNNVAIPGGVKITDLDRAFLIKTYPGAIQPPNLTLTITRAKADSIKVAAKNLSDMVNRILK